MTRIAIGSTSNSYLAAGQTLAIASNGGLLSVTITPDGGTARTAHLGPLPSRRVFGPYSSGTKVFIKNNTCDYLLQVGDGSPAGILRNSLGDPIGYGDPGSGLQIPPAVRRSNQYSRKTLGSDRQNSGTSTHQTRTYVPMGGMLVDVAMVFTNDVPGQTLTVNTHAFAGGSDYNSINPSEPIVVGTPGLAIAGPALAIKPNIGQTAKQRIYLPPDVTDPKWSTVYRRSSHTNGRIYGSNTPSLYNSVAQKHKERLDFKTVTNVNDSFTTPDGSDVHLRSSDLLIYPVSAMSAATAYFFGDSRTRGQGSTSDDYGWPARLMENIASRFADLIGYENHGISGTNTTQFGERLTAVLTNRAPDLVFFQCGSSNDTNPWTEATVTAAMVLTANVEAELRRRGIAFRTATEYGSFAANTAEKAAQQQRLNDWVRATFPGRFFDFELSEINDRSGALPGLAAWAQADVQHRNDAGHAASAVTAEPSTLSGLGLAA